MCFDMLNNIRYDGICQLDYLFFISIFVNISLQTAQAVNALS